MDTMANRLAHALKERDMKPPDLIKATGLSKAAVYFLLDGTTTAGKVRAETIEAVCKALRIRSEWLRRGKGSMEEGADTQDMDWPDILAFKQAASLGPGAVPDEYAETYKLKFRSDSLRRKHLRPDKLGVVYGKGDSMLPRIRSGDAILFDMGDTEPKDGALYVISYKGDLLAKRLSLLGGRWFIESLNQNARDYRKPQPIDEFEHFKIHGRVRWIGSWED